jgi:hypothetical protein
LTRETKKPPVAVFVTRRGPLGPLKRYFMEFPEETLPPNHV